MYFGISDRSGQRGPRGYLKMPPRSKFFFPEKYVLLPTLCHYAISWIFHGPLPNNSSERLKKCLISLFWYYDVIMSPFFRNFAALDRIWRHNQENFSKIKFGFDQNHPQTSRVFIAFLISIQKIGLQSKIPILGLSRPGILVVLANAFEQSPKICVVMTL